MGELPYSPSPLTPAQPMIAEKTTYDANEKLLAYYDDHLTSYESQFHAYKTWFDEDAWAGAVLIVSIEDYFAADILGFDQTHTPNGSLLFVTGQGTPCFDSFHVYDVSLIPNLSMLLMSMGQIIDHKCGHS